MQIRSQAREQGRPWLYGMGHSSTAIMDDMAKELPLSKERRPQWDKDPEPFKDLWFSYRNHHR
jgi:hypothetical protein